MPPRSFRFRPCIYRAPWRAKLTSPFGLRERCDPGP
jgi:hypothetical protein